MLRITPRIISAGLIGLFVIASAGERARAEGYPSRMIKLVVPAGPGGPTDLLARLIAERMAATLGQAVIVDNRGGAGGAIAARAVAAAEPDGYTLLFGNTATLANIPAVSKSAGYDPTKNFAAVAKIMDSYMLLVVRPDFPAQTVGELIAMAKANPGKLNHGAAGAGNLTHLRVSCSRFAPAWISSRSSTRAAPSSSPRCSAVRFSSPSITLPACAR
jgi:tripartite-type tricarboxylate transporter receptor subunit TctC